MTPLAEKLIARHDSRQTKIVGRWNSGELFGAVTVLEDNGMVVVQCPDGINERWNRVEFLKKFKPI
jgi:hypothetical protein